MLNVGLQRLDDGGVEAGRVHDHSHAEEVGEVEYCFGYGDAERVRSNPMRAYEVSQEVFIHADYVSNYS